MLKEKPQALIPIMTAVCFFLLVVYLFSQDAGLAGPF